MNNILLLQKFQISISQERREEIMRKSFRIQNKKNSLLFQDQQENSLTFLRRKKML